ncbi:[protein-PII] uridylyltransferase [Coralloluteibacterium stylophorae]|uniref:Bifunctional uridylyltransferase/uridylyl-removing enzyme n=1 Tax=Coralloluteibacterium stylophorae TaxID=1776034 RepID=A0A8J7VVP9_9GAMM|nr:[protein-PII] uridylyltransferase [Coralloluteibacterium stylophorae]
MSAPAPADALVARLADAGADDAAWREAAREALAAVDADLARRYREDEDIDVLLGDRAAAVDAVVRSAWLHCVGDDAPLHLLATGGYGRGELFPHSDVDLLVLAEPIAQAANADGLARFFTALWDAGIAPGHAVRSLDQCTEVAAVDVSVATALMETRLLAGDSDAPEWLARAIAPDVIWPAHAYFLAKRQEQRERHARFNDTAYNLEPNVKDGPGGLRDLHTVLWIARRIAAVGELGDLVPLGQLGADELATLRRERRALSHLRFGLHLVAGRREERLLFDYQKPLAAYVGLRDLRRDNLAVEQMMQGFFRCAATVLRLNDRLLQRFEEQLEGAGEQKALDAEFAVRRGYLYAREPQRLARDPERVFRLFAMWAAHPELRGLHSQTARVLAEGLPDFPPYERAAPAVREAFMALLRGEGAVSTLARMARSGVLARYLPVFGQVAGRMQYDLFHVYTVDQHTLVVLRNLEGFERTERDPRFVLAQEIRATLPAPELLLLAALFHDLAKGRGGDHSELGAEDVRAFCAAHGLPQADAELVSWLVLRHLLMSVTAQKQDISDPGVVARFATEVADRERLDYLYLLTVADIAGTSPKLWNAWKDRLLADLYTATRLALRRGLENPLRAEERIAQTRQAARERLVAEGVEAARIDALWQEFPQEMFLRWRADEIAWQTRGILEAPRDRPLVLARPHVAGKGARPGALEVFVHTSDRDSLFAALVATLDRMGLNIVQARVLTSRDGMSLDGLRVLVPEGREIACEEVERALAAVLLRPLEEARPTRRSTPRQLRHFRVPARIEFSPSRTPGRTLMSLVCTDRPGLLADVTQVLRRHRLRVHDARIATFGERVEDLFQITDEGDRPFEDPDLQQALREALFASVGGDA